MADFHQNIVPTITRLEAEDLGRMHQRIVDAAPQMPIGVIVPATFRELSSSATRKMIDELQKMAFVRRVYFSLWGATETQCRKAVKILAPLEDRGVLLWNEAPAVLEQIDRISAVAPVGAAGKGRAVWAALGYVLGQKEVAVLAIHDADIATYNRAFLVRLLYPVVHLRFQFSKAFYARYSDEQLHARVVRLFYFPFVRSLREIAGLTEFLEFMADFRYPLSGECALFASLAAELRFPSEWGIEVGILAEMHRLVRPHRVCQVEITHRYNQQHQEVGHDPRHGLQRMVADVSRTFFTHLAAGGCQLGPEFLLCVKHSYLAHARAILPLYESYADINNLIGFDPNQELRLIDQFAEALDGAFKEFQKQPLATQLVPAWRRNQSALPEFVAAFDGVK